MKPIPRNLRKKKPGPQGRWKSRAAKDLGVSLPHLCQVVSGQRQSLSLSARLADWKRRHHIAA